MSHSTRDLLHIHFLTFLWGFTAILGLLISLEAVEMVLYRTVISTIGLWVIVKILRKELTITGREFIIFLVTGALVSAHWILFFVSARVSNATISLAGFATVSLWTSFIEPIVFKRKVRFFEVLLGLIVMAGLYIVFRVEFDHALGLVLGIGSAILMAVFTVINNKLAPNHGHYQLTFFEMMGAAISTAIFLPFLAMVCTVYAFSASVEIMKRVSAFVINLIVNLEPVYGIILAAIILGEHKGMHWGFYLGTLIILAAVLSYPILNKRYQKRYLPIDTLR